tara:strand:- start:2890 stop:3129 length:240 start_codon:yes stop_codon:yes gene_type:complete
MMTHDLSPKCWGCNYNVLDIKDKGMKVSLCGWHSGIKSGDFLLLKQGDGTTRYLVDSIRYCGEPDDMWFAEASFAPRDN